MQKVVLTFQIEELEKWYSITKQKSGNNQYPPRRRTGFLPVN
jgi:hypothetical protein